MSKLKMDDAPGETVPLYRVPWAAVGAAESTRMIKCGNSYVPLRSAGQLVLVAVAVADGRTEVDVIVATGTEPVPTGDDGGPGAGAVVAETVDVTSVVGSALDEAGASPDVDADGAEALLATDDAVDDDATGEDTDDDDTEEQLKSYKGVSDNVVPTTPK